MKFLLTSIFLYGFLANAQICNSNGNIVIFSNYDGGNLNINVDVNIPNLKIGIVSYEAVAVTFSGPFVGNITEVEYAGYNNSPNFNCGASIATTSFSGTPGGVTPNIEFLPPVTYNDPNGYTNIDCGYSCGTGNQGGCNTAAQIYDYFENVFGETVYFHKTQYGCWSITQNISDGGNCCAAPPAPPVANFSISDTVICTGECIDFTDQSSNSPTSWSWSFSSNLSDTSSLQNPSNICFSTPGTYQITLITSNPYGSDTITQALSVNAIDTTVSVSGINLTSNASGATWQWINCTTNATIVGANSATYTPTSNGNYAVIVTQNSCTDTSACILVNSLSLDQNEINNLLSVYPNPSIGIFVLYDVDGLLSGQEVTVTNILGETVSISNISSNKTYLDLSSVSDGIYFITIDTHLGRLNTKIYKE